MSDILDNCKEVFSNWKYALTGLGVLLLLLYLFHINTHYDLIAGNYGITYLNLQIFSQVAISILFALFVPLTIYKIILFSSFSGKSQGSSLAATIIAVIVGGCPSCSITFATYLGLAGVVSFLPYDGLELKLLTIPLLLYADYTLLRDLKVCKVKKPKKK